jgi:hypothetical protein
LRAANAGAYMCHASFESVSGNESINVTALCKKISDKFVCHSITTYVNVDSFQWTWS